MNFDGYFEDFLSGRAFLPLTEVHPPEPASPVIPLLKIRSVFLRVFPEIQIE